MSAFMTYPEPLVNRWADTSKNTWDKILQHGVGGGTTSPSKPVIDAQGRMLLLAEEDHTWHYIYLFTDEGEVRLSPDQASQPPPGHRGFFIWQASDGTKHRTQVALDEGQYHIRVDQGPTGAQPTDYTTLALGISPAFTVFHNVTLTLDEAYTEAVDPTPNP